MVAHKVNKIKNTQEGLRHQAAATKREESSWTPKPRVVEHPRTGAGPGGVENANPPCFNHFNQLLSTVDFFDSKNETTFGLKSLICGALLIKSLHIAVYRWTNDYQVNTVVEGFFFGALRLRFGRPWN